jgi:GH35 family endo-1,4-beta-xylanase
VIRGIALIERPEALLFYNDYNLEFTGPKSNAAYAFVQELLAAGVPIDGVGFRVTWTPSTATRTCRTTCSGSPTSASRSH